MGGVTDYMASDDSVGAWNEVMFWIRGSKI